MRDFFKVSTDLFHKDMYNYLESLSQILTIFPIINYEKLN